MEHRQIGNVVYITAPTGTNWWNNPTAGANGVDVNILRTNTEVLGGRMNGGTGTNCFQDSLLFWKNGTAYPSPNDELWIKVIWEDELEHFEKYIWDSDEEATIHIPFPYWEKPIATGPGLVATDLH